MLALKDRAIYFGHAGSHPSSQKILLYREQLFRWKTIIAVLQIGAEDLVERATKSFWKKILC